MCVCVCVFVCVCVCVCMCLWVRARHPQQKSLRVSKHTRLLCLCWLLCVCWLRGSFVADSARTLIDTHTPIPPECFADATQYFRDTRKILSAKTALPWFPANRVLIIAPISTTHKKVENMVHIKKKIDAYGGKGVLGRCAVRNQHPVLLPGPLDVWVVFWKKINSIESIYVYIYMYYVYLFLVLLPCPLDVWFLYLKKNGWIESTFVYICMCVYIYPVLLPGSLDVWFWYFKKMNT